MVLQYTKQEREFTYKGAWIDHYNKKLEKVRKQKAVVSV